MTKIDWENSTNYFETVGSTDKIFPFPTTQSIVQLTNKGNANLIYTIGSQSGTLTPGQQVRVTENVSSFTLRSASGNQFFELWSTEAGTEKDEKIPDFGSQINDLVSSMADKTTQLTTKRATSTYDKILNGQTVKIVCKGDSITYSVNPDASQVANPYPKILQDRLSFMFDNQNITVINSGVPGATAQNGLDNFQTSVLNYAPNMVIIMFGANDSYNAISIDTYKDNLKQMITKSKQNNIEVIICSPTPYMKNLNLSNPNSRMDVATYAKAAKEVAESEKVDFVDMFGEFSTLFANNAINRSIYTDDLHLTSQGYQLIADIVIKEKLAYCFNPKLASGQYVCFNSPYIKTNFDRAYSSSSQKLYYNLLMNVSTPGDYIKWAVFNDKPNMALSILNYQANNTTTAKLKNFGADFATLNLNAPTTGVYDIETDTNLDVGLYCFSVNASDIGNVFTPSGYYLKSTKGLDTQERQTPALLNSWVNFGSGARDFRATKFRNKVTLEATIKGGTTTTITTLPIGFRPTQNIIVPAIGNDGVNYATIPILIQTDGTVLISYSNATAYSVWLSISGINFYTD